MVFTPKRKATAIESLKLANKKRRELNERLQNDGADVSEEAQEPAESCQRQQSFDLGGSCENSETKSAERSTSRNFRSNFSEMVIDDHNHEPEVYETIFPLIESQQLLQFHSDMPFDDPPVSSSVTSSNNELIRISQLEIIVQEKDDELAFASEELYSTRDEIIMIRKKVDKLEKDKENIIIRIRKVQLSRDDYRIKADSLSKKSRKPTKMVTFLKSYGKRFTARKSTTVYKYSELENHTSKKRRQLNAILVLKDIAKEEDITVLLNDIIKFCDKSEELSFKFKLSLWESVVLKSKCQLAGHQLEVMKQLFVKFTGKDVLPPVKLTCQLANQSSKIELFQESVIRDKNKNVAVVTCVNLEQLISWRLSEIGSDLVFDQFTGDQIVIGLCGDSGGGNTKFCLIFGNLEHPNSVENVITVAVYDGPDTAECMQKYIPNVIQQFDNLKSISYTVNGVLNTRTVRTIIVGDFKMVAECLTHKNSSANFNCFYCVAENFRGDRMKLKDVDVSKKSDSRTLASFFQFAKTGAFGVHKGSGPLFKSVHLFDYLAGMLHLVTGVFKRYVFEPLWVYAVRYDNTTSFVIQSDKTKTTTLADEKVQQLQLKYNSCSDRQKKAALYSELKKLKKERLELDSVLSGTSGGKWKELEECWEQIGASRQAFFQTYSGNHTRKLLTPAAIEKTFKVFETMMDDTLYGLRGVMEELAVIMSLSANRLLSQTDLDKLENSIFRLSLYLADCAPEDTVTLKLHVLLFHTHDTACSHGTLGRVTEQGVECKHSQWNRIDRRFSSTRKTETRWLMNTREMLCVTVAADFLKALRTASRLTV
ncbi:hypothetical protein CAEBREN_05710 [Caenorhabditis brenneri]|uniref:Uncharacterized protein n=1 Tax=Caenorhabditis brenneri TaxID=135651 RepID=G0NKI6_CAEBE|nr:hypothetical protein CAEBREN_05710 [Caenorhabditis brenneri]